MVFSLGGRVAVVAVEATAAARRADYRKAASAVGLIAALGRSDDNLGLVLFGEEAAALRTVTSMALKRAQPPGVERDMDLPPLRGPASTAAALAKAQDLLERIEDKDESTVVWIGATSPDGELDLIAPTIDMFRGRSWRILVAPTADVGDGVVLDEMAAGTRGAQFATDGGDALLRGVLQLAADMHLLFRRVDPTDDAPLKAPEAARRVLYVALTPPGSDLLGARTADKAGEPVWNHWVRRPASDEPPYRVVELAHPESLDTRTWKPHTVGTPSVEAYAELPLRVILAPGSPPIEVAGGAKVPIRMTVELAAGAHPVLAPRLTADANFDGEAPTVLQPETSAEGTLTFSGLIAAPSGVARPACTLRLQLEDPAAGTWVWTRRLQVRATDAGPSPLEVDPPELDLGPSWEDEPSPPVPLTLRSTAPLQVEPEPTAALEITPAKLELVADGELPLQVAVARGSAPGPLEAQISLRVRDAAGRDLAGQFVRTTATVIRWTPPDPLAFGPRKPGESASLTVPTVWSPIPPGATVGGFLEGPDGARVELTCFAEAEGGITVAALVPEDAPTGRYTGAVLCGAPGLTPRRVPATLDVGEGIPPAPAPSIASIDPAVGPLEGGNEITIRGSAFLDPPTVQIGGRPASVVSVADDTLVVAAPASPDPGEVDVLVTNPDGQVALAMLAYTYDPSAGVVTTPPLHAEPPSLLLTGDAGDLVEAELTLPNATADRLPGKAMLTDLHAADGSDLISARFDCAADLVQPADGNPARIVYRVRLPADVASGKYMGTLTLRDPLTDEVVDVAVEVDVK